MVGVVKGLKMGQLADFSGRKSSIFRTLPHLKAGLKPNMAPRARDKIG
jgi:hypothetical protein